MKKYRISLIIILALIMGGLLAACTGAGAANSYPGITAGKDMAYLAYNFAVWGVNLKDGSLAWRFPEKQDNSKSFFAPPAISGNNLIVGDFANNLYAISADKGAQVWTFTSDAGHFVAGPLVVNDTILAPSSDHQLYALTLDGKLRWKFKTDNILWARPASNGTLVYLPGMDHNLYALNLADGKVAWQKDLGSPLQGSPLLAQDGTLYIVPMDSTVWAIDSSNGNIRWKQAAVSQGQVWSTPAMDSNAIYFGSSDNKVYAVSTQAGANRLLWSLDLGDAVIGGGTLYKDGIIFPTENGKAYGVSTKGQKTSFNLSVNGKLYTAPVVTDDLVILAITQGQNSKYMKAFGYDGSEKWSFTPPQ